MEPNCDTAGLTHDLLKELFDYRDGELYWKVSRQGRKLGVPAGAIRSDGYRVIVINGKHYRTHRLIFLYHHGFLPEYLDHIDCDPSNNDISNLRGATMQENGANRKKNKSHNGKPTSSRFKGVSWYKRYGKWESSIHINCKKKRLGLFDSEIKAAKTYNHAAVEAFGEFKNLNKFEVI